MLRVVWCFIFFALMLNVCEATNNKLIIDASKFEINDKKGLTVFTGNVKMSRGKDTIKAHRIEVYTTKPKKNKKKQMKKFVAIGKVSFEIFVNDKHYIGRGDKILYNLVLKKYTISGNGYIEEKKNKTKLAGNKIFLDEKTGEAVIQGSKSKPVRLIMDLGGDDNKTSKKKK